MSEWKTVPLGELLSIKPEYGANASAIEYDGLNPRYLRITDISDDGKLIETGKTSIELSKAEPYILDAEDIVIARTGNTVGKSYIHQSKNGVLAYAGYLIKFEINQNVLIPQFFFHFLHSPDYFRWLNATLRTGAQPNVNAQEYCSIGIFHPTALPEQRKIARILSTVDAVIENTEAAITKYKAIKSGMMRDLFTRGIDVKTGKLRPRYEDAPELYKESELGWVPREWKIFELSKCLSILKDGTHLPPKRVLEGPLLLSVQNIIGGKFILTNNDTRVPWEFYNTTHKTWQIQPGDVFLTIVGATIGKACIAPNNLPPYMLQRSVAILRGQIGLLSTPFLYFYVLSSFFQTQLMNRANQTAQPGVYLGEIAKIKIALPKADEQNIAETSFNSISTIIESETASLEKFKSIKLSLMSDLLTGKVRVKYNEKVEAM
jgi:type I restriction enzyme, S subunit